MSPGAPRERQQRPRPEPQRPPTTLHRREILRLYLEPSERRLQPEHRDPGGRKGRDRVAGFFERTRKLLPSGVGWGAGLVSPVGKANAILLVTKTDEGRERAVGGGDRGGDGVDP